jgi:8-oxo-dGTP diphosphatase/2-hydroxy-dATP diphosphatase
MPKLIQPLTLCILREGNGIFLALKKRGFGNAKWNGYGGKLLEGETLEDALLREVEEESTVILTAYEKRGEMIFTFPDIIRHVYIYEGIQWNGKPAETEEMNPKWFTFDKIPFSNMWISDTGWFPYFLKRIPFKGEGVFDENHSLLSLEVKEV